MSWLLSAINHLSANLIAIIAILVSIAMGLITAKMSTSTQKSSRSGPFAWFMVAGGMISFEYLYTQYHSRRLLGRLGILEVQSANTSVNVFYGML